MKKLIIHIGYPKTATTTLQLNVFTSLMKKGEIEYLNHLEKGHPNHGEFSVKRVVGYVLGRDLNLNWQEEAEKFVKINKKTTVLSNEGISHASEKYPTVASAAGATRNAKKIYEIFSPYFDKIEILMTVREQSSMITSQYTQEYYNLCNYNPQWSNFETWFSDNFKQNNIHQGQFLDYHAMFTAYAKYFGKENIYVLVYEDLINDKNSFYQKIGHILNINCDKIKLLFESSSHNKTKKVDRNYVKTDRGDFHAVLFSIAHKFFRKKDSKLFWIAKKLSKTLIPEKLLKYRVGSGAKIRRLTDVEQKFIKQLFNRSNEQLATDAKLGKEKMIQYGYIKQ